MAIGDKVEFKVEGTVIFEGEGHILVDAGDDLVVKADKGYRTLSSSGKSAMIATTSGKRTVILDNAAWTHQYMMYRKPTPEDMAILHGEV